MAPGTSFRAFAERFAAFAREAIADDRWRAAVAERDGRLVGTVWLQLVRKVPAPSAKGEFIGYVTNAYVAPAERDGGVGADLLQRLIEQVAAVPIEVLIVWPTERSASFYERAGFVRSDAVWQRYLIMDPYGVWRAADGGEGAGAPTPTRG